MTEDLTNTGILDCGHMPSPHSEITTGYGQDTQGRKHCYACIAKNDTKTMMETGTSASSPLYLTHKNGKYSISNWPGSLTFTVLRSSEGNHNIGRTRTDVWFDGPDGFVWHGVQIGEWNQVLHARRTKQAVR